MKKVIGWLLMAFLLFVLVAVTSLAVGWVQAILIWAFSALLTPLFVKAIILIDTTK